LPAVSIVTPVYNGARFLPETIESVEAQTFRDWEWLLVDDGSTDDSLEICRKAAAADGRIRVLSHPAGVNRGQAASRNLAIQHSRGDLLAFLDADDLWIPEKLEFDRASLAAHPNAMLLYSRLLFWHEGAPQKGGRNVLGTLGVRCNCVLPAPLLLAHVAENLYDFGCQFPAPSCLVVRRGALPAGEELFDPTLRRYEDVAPLVKVLLRHPAIVCDDVRVFHRRHEGSFSHSPTPEADFVRITGWIRTYLSGSNCAPEDLQIVLNALNSVKGRRRRELLRRAFLAAGRRVLPFPVRDWLWWRYGQKWLSPGGRARRDI